MSSLNYTPVDYLINPVADAENYTPLVFREVVEHEPEEAVKPFVSPRPELIKVDGDLQKMGVAASGAPAFVNYKKIKLPITDAEIHKGLKAPITTSFRWLAEQCVYLVKRAHGLIKGENNNVGQIITQLN